MATNPYNDSTLTLTKRSRYYNARPQVEAVIRSHEYEDGGKTFNRLNSVAPQTWELIYSGLEYKTGIIDEAAIFDDHFDANWLDTPFLFVDKAGTSHAVYYLEYERSHDAHKSWIQTRRVLLIEYPGVTADDLDISYIVVGSDFVVVGSDRIGVL